MRLGHYKELIKASKVRIEQELVVNLVKIMLLVSQVVVKAML